MAVFWLWLSLVLPASAQGCADLATLESQAYRGRLDGEQKGCLETMLVEAAPDVRVKISFLLILQAYMNGDDEQYVTLMRRHLSEVHTTDPEVAYLYANWLEKHEPANHDEILRWAQVAFQGRLRWLDDHVGYVAIVRSLYDMMIQASLERAIDVEQRYDAAPSPEGAKQLDTARRLARYYLVIAAPCLHDNQCGPTYEVEVEGQTSCEDLDALSDLARHARIGEDETRCLRARWNRTGKPRLLTILMDSADHEPQGDDWEALLAWHWDATGTDDPLLAARHASYLAGKGPERASDVMKWSDLALADRPKLEQEGGRSLIGHVLSLRVTASQQLVDAAIASGTGIDAAREALRVALDEQSEWCRTAKDCKEN